MPTHHFPPLPLAAWQATRGTLHGYLNVLGDVRAALSARQKHSSHRSLRVAAAGLTTTPIPYGALTVELLLDLANHRLLITNSRGEQWQQPVRGQAAGEFYDQVMGGLALMGVPAPVERARFAPMPPGEYDTAAVERFWLALTQVDGLLKRFRGTLRGETSDVQFWPHGLDLAMLWFSGRLIPGKDPNSPRDADEQMNFGFSTGDAGIPEPYFYATAYPLPAALPSTPLPEGVVWHNQGWQGAVLRYAALVEDSNAGERLVNYWSVVQSAGAGLMK
jgi:hypothetical protein